MEGRGNAARKNVCVLRVLWAVRKQCRVKVESDDGSSVSNIKYNGVFRRW